MAKKSSSAQAKATKPKREYDNTNRAKKSEETQRHIIQSLVELLAEREGGDVQISEVAERSGITQRTVFRFFKDKKSLHEAMDKYLLSFLTAGNDRLKTESFVEFARGTFALFDKHRSLTMAYVLSPYGQEIRKLLRKKLNQSMILKIVEENKIQLNETKQMRLALITTLVSAKIWYDLQADYGYSGEEMGPALEWALKTLISGV